MPTPKIRPNVRGMTADKRTVEHSRLTPEQRRARALRASIAGGVSIIRKNSGQLTPEQREAILEALS